SARLEDPRHRHLEVTVGFDRGVDQLVERRVLEELPPPEVADRVGPFRAPRMAQSRRAAVRIWRSPSGSVPALRPGSWARIASNCARIKATRSSRGSGRPL